ncbi:hypothetical protein T310_8625, partial [Rasamsonia emersonii CBS 393.64]
AGVEEGTKGLVARQLEGGCLLKMTLIASTPDGEHVACKLQPCQRQPPADFRGSWREALGGGQTQRLERLESGEKPDGCSLTGGRKGMGSF